MVCTRSRQSINSIGKKLKSNLKDLKHNVYGSHGYDMMCKSMYVDNHELLLH